ncbi:MAG TPA: CapA family protein [Vicinamibacterales bacterium]|jgi:poly-gamma-glutamate synthesis protein (capsule biosynthesis protein)
MHEGDILSGPGKHKPLTILAAGDICPGDKAVMGLGVRSKTQRHGSDFPFEHVKSHLAHGDIVLANLEGYLSSEASSGGQRARTFCGREDFAEAMVRAGFNVVSVANNHVLEHGEAAFVESVRILKRAGLRVCGLRSRLDKYYSEPVFFDAQGIRTALVGYNWISVDRLGNADEHIAQSLDSAVNYSWHREHPVTAIERANANVIRDLRTLKKEADVVALVAHWGYEFVTVPPYGVTREARTFVDAGADLIIGIHPHVIQGAESYKNGLILYSLGNFVFDMRRRLTRYSMIAEIHVDEAKKTDVKFTPFFINRSFQPSPASEKDAAKVRAIIANSELRLASPVKEQVLCDDVLYRLHEDRYNRGKALAILDHLAGAARRPAVVLTILRKLWAAAGVLVNRLRGRRVRW